MAWMETERQALVQTLHGTDPDAPTLCGGWNVSRLLAHLVLRDQEPWKLVGDILRRDPPGREKALGVLAEEARTDAGYRALVDRFAAGPAAWSPVGWGGDAANLIEYVVHHEDIRRGAGDVPPRELPRGEEAELRRRLPVMAKLLYLRSPVGVVLELPTGEQARVRSGEKYVTVSGGIVELVLHTLGRRKNARVDIAGDFEAQRAFARFTSPNRPQG
ncbi:TIGR03085 family metal-binding protein [Arthrobacter sp. zg-Y916]|uniref:TIGR03085 family metal-binding protein n=1 Tax=Arthrobacter sp. zg-Y916 TaxID=2894190 RepID=UPI001E486917|nr:TIGR03085 family metal-binding protein [Arthrobacter sp. zg-Y916]MCC9192301.1 TIGR03085 family metal-binding protein [Arthrobacter sp. zg-Y916]